MYWQNNNSLRILGPEGIVSKGGRAFKPRKVLQICGLTLEVPDGRKRQYLFKRHGEPKKHVKVIGSSGNVTK